MSTEASIYQSFFDRLDATIVALDDMKGLEAARDAQDLLRRAGFVLLNLMNGLAGTLPHLVIEGEAPETGAEAGDESPVEPPSELSP